MQNKQTINFDDVNKVYLMPKDFFEAPNFIERYRNELRKYRRRIKLEEKENIRGSLNAFYLACINSPSINDNVKLEVHLGFFEILNAYAQQYSIIDTYLNVIKAIESPNLKENLFCKHNVWTSLIYSEALIKHFNLFKQEESKFSSDETEKLIKAKSCLWKIYVQHLERKHTLNQLDLSHCLTLLSATLMELSRWFEPLYYLNIAKEKLNHNTNAIYSRALLLEAIKDKTCLNYSGLLLLKIIDTCMEAYKLPQTLAEQRSQLKTLERKCRSDIRNYNLNLKTLRKHKSKVKKSTNQYNKYKKYCIENQLYLNEHSFYCECEKAIIDNLKIETSHQHTKIEWVKQFNSILDIAIYDFVIARYSFYNSFEEVKAPNLYTSVDKKIESIIGIKNALIKNSFKTLYSILDQIAHGIFQVMEIDYISKLENKFPDINERPKIYFLNMWDDNLELFDDKHFEENIYLTSLYSISRDLSKKKYASLSSFRKLRNAMEHKALYVVKAKSEFDFYKSKGEEVCYKHELVEKTKILMLLTKSAIFSFTYLVRHQSYLVNEKLSIDAI